MGLRCDNCGFRFDSSAFFRREKGGLIRRTKTVCEGCSAYQPSAHETRVGRRLLLAQLCCLPWIGYFFDHSLAQGILFSTMVVASLATLPLRIIVHEAGHALAVKAMGKNLISVTIGRGPRLFSKRARGARIEFHRYIFGGGKTRYLSLEDGRGRWRDGVILISGPGANFVGAGLAFWLGALVGNSQTLAALLWTGAFAGAGLSQAATGIFNLVPQRFGDDETVESDGRRLLHLFRRPAPKVTELEQVWRVDGLLRLERFEEAIDLALSVAGKSEYRLLLISQALHGMSRSRGHSSLVQWYLDHEDEIECAKLGANDAGTSAIPWIYATVAWSALETRDSALHGLVDSLSRQAFEAKPAVPEIAGTHGAWLTVQGELESGLALLSAAVRAAQIPLERADFCRYLARGFEMQGDKVRAAGFEALAPHFAASG
jgi:hypothetical protein